MTETEEFFIIVGKLLGRFLIYGTIIISFIYWDFNGDAARLIIVGSVVLFLSKHAEQTIGERDDVE